ncbi:MAG: hypothetical protein N2258_01310 [Brevinematales bacterium]|nr:hypothetical protein [Brevinematales bacterium]
MKLRFYILLILGFLFINGCSGEQPASLSSGTSSSSSSIFIPPSPFPWDWNGIIGTGQSLGVGGQAPVKTTNQRYGNLKLSLGNGTVPPWNSDLASLSMVPLVEPIRPLATGYPSPYPRNIYGETFHTAMADQISTLMQNQLGSNFITVHTVVGEAGQGYSAIKKGAVDTGTTGRAYSASIFETEAITKIARKAGKTFGISAIVITHGETDSGSSMYGTYLRQLWTDYNADIPKITGQTNKIIMFVNQQHAYGNTLGSRSPATLAQWKVGILYPDDIVCTGPKYQYEYTSDGVHMTAKGYDMLGEKLGQIYYKRLILKENWQPLQPTNVTRNGNTITVYFNVPVPPLRWDTSLPAPHQTQLTQWANGKGFEIFSNTSNYVISSIEIVDNSVVITSSDNLPATGLYIGYAMTSDGVAPSGHTFRSGQLCDSDPFIGSLSGEAQPNYCVSFYIEVP